MEWSALLMVVEGGEDESCGSHCERNVRNNDFSTKQITKVHPNIVNQVAYPLSLSLEV